MSATEAELEAAFQSGFDRGFDRGKEQAEGVIKLSGAAAKQLKSTEVDRDRLASELARAAQLCSELVEAMRARYMEEPADYMRRVMALVAEVGR